MDCDKCWHIPVWLYREVPLRGIVETTEHCQHVYLSFLYIGEHICQKMCPQVQGGGLDPQNDRGVPPEIMERTPLLPRFSIQMTRFYSHFE